MLVGFLASCVALLIASFLVTVWPGLHPRVARPSRAFRSKATSCKASSSPCARRPCSRSPRIKASAHEWKSAAAFAVLGLAFLVDVFFVTTGRTALVIIPALIVVYGIWRAGWKGLLGASLATAVLASIVWFASPFVRERVTAIYTETAELRTAERQFVVGRAHRILEEVAPLHRQRAGLRSRHRLDRRAVRAGRQSGKGASAIGSANPHNQTFAVGIQLGLVGMALLWAMWIAHLLLFRGGGLVAWIGLVVVASNIVGSLFNSFIFDFTEGWIYVFGVGVAAGMVRRPSDAAAKAAQGS